MDQALVRGRKLLGRVADMCEVKPFARHCVQLLKPDARAVEMQRVDQETAVFTLDGAADSDGFLEIGDIGPGDEFKVHRQTHLLRSEERRVGKECRSRWS